MQHTQHTSGDCVYHAAARAIESKLSNALYNDPLAEALAGPKAMQTATDIASGNAPSEASSPSRLTPCTCSTCLNKKRLDIQSLAQRASFYGYLPDGTNQPRKLGWITLRTRYLDDALARAFAQLPGQPCQAVLLGAGMDTRPWRMKDLGFVR